MPMSRSRKDDRCGARAWARSSYLDNIDPAPSLWSSCPAYCGREKLRHDMRKKIKCYFLHTSLSLRYLPSCPSFAREVIVSSSVQPSIRSTVRTTYVLTVRRSTVVQDFSTRDESDHFRDASTSPLRLL